MLMGRKGEYEGWNDMMYEVKEQNLHRTWSRAIALKSENVSLPSSAPLIL